MDEVECIAANLIFRKYVRGYISHKAKVMVVAKVRRFALRFPLLQLVPVSNKKYLYPWPWRHCRWTPFRRSTQQPWRTDPSTAGSICAEAGLLIRSIAKHTHAEALIPPRRAAHKAVLFGLRARLHASVSRRCAMRKPLKPVHIGEEPQLTR